MRILIVVLLFFTGNIVTGQVSTSVDVRLPSDQGYGSVNYNNPSELGVKKQVTVDNDEIAGSPFWKKDWNTAYVFLASGGIVKLSNIKLNLLTNEIYFLDIDNGIRSADASNISKIIFVDKSDSLKAQAVFQKLNYDSNVFLQVLNSGSNQLLKATNISVVKRGYNTLLGKDEYAYDSKTVYYLFHSAQISKVDVLNKEHLVALLDFSDGYNKWMEENKNKLRGETDWVNFLKYYNSKQ
jgi:hypothetical protein